MSKYFNQFSDIEPIEIMPGFRGKFIHTKSLTLALWEIEAGSTLPLHQHPHEQVSQLVSGEFEMTVAGEYQKAIPGELITIPGHIDHEGKALTDCVIFDIFSPVREDYKARQLEKQG
ncbi:MAG: cupin domain-containing protein [Bacteroidota bacterium]